MTVCSLTEDEAAALRLLGELKINEAYTDIASKAQRYVFKASNALYAHAIYKLCAMLNDDACWIVARDTSMISDYAFEKVK